jgi:hypothetical protein
MFNSGQLFQMELRPPSAFARLNRKAVLNKVSGTLFIIFFNVHSPTDGSGGRLDQNRVLVGFNRSMNEHLNVDAGYPPNRQYGRVGRF